MRMGRNQSQSEQCRNWLHVVHPRDRPRPIQKYMQCNALLHTAIDKCLHDATDVCHGKKVVVAKTVRVTMEMVEKLLKIMPHLKVRQPGVERHGGKVV